MINKNMFPEKTKWLKRPIGWEDLGKKKTASKIVDGENVTTTTVHQFCNTPVRIGKEGNVFFTFCPKCLVKTTY